MSDIEKPKVKRAVAFFDGQNLYRHAKEAFGYHFPNYDPIKLFDAVCQEKQLKNCGVRFYTGTPSIAKDPKGQARWANHLLAMRRSGIHVTHRELRYRETKIDLPDGSQKTIITAQEKGIDIRIALDVIRTTITNQLDVAVVFSQDQYLAEIPADLKEIAKAQGRWIHMISAFPSGPHASSRRGINGTEWFRIDRETYDACLDPRDYRQTHR